MISPIGLIPAALQNASANAMPFPHACAWVNATASGIDIELPLKELELDVDDEYASAAMPSRVMSNANRINAVLI